ncbi:MAG: hypothetical protein ACO2OX_01775 [Candidatus Nanopusillus sp.]
MHRKYYEKTMIREKFNYELIKKIKVLDENIDIILKFNPNKEIEFINEDNFRFYVDLNLDKKELLDIIKKVEDYLIKTSKNLILGTLAYKEEYKLGDKLLLKFYSFGYVPKSLSNNYDCTIDLTVFNHDEKIVFVNCYDILKGNEFRRPLFYTYNIISTIKIIVLNEERIRNEIKDMEKHALCMLEEVIKLISK